MNEGYLTLRRPTLGLVSLQLVRDCMGDEIYLLNSPIHFYLNQVKNDTDNECMTDGQLPASLTRVRLLVC